MELEELKKLVSKNRERVILVEEGKPSLVLLSFDDYKKMAGLNPGEDQSNPSQSNPSPKEEQSLQESNKKEELKLEDLPL